MRKGVFLAVLAVALAGTAGCGFKLAGRWNGTGEVGQATYFKVSLDVTDRDKPTAVFQYGGAESSRLPVCGLKEVEKHVEFRLDADGHAPACSGAVNPLTFVGDYGADAITGVVLDSRGTRIGLFRAFRVPE
jgi:hypothetical protein